MRWLAKVQMMGANDNGEANAKLIAAAPEMLKELISLKDFIMDDPDTAEHYNMEGLNELIQKATK